MDNVLKQKIKEGKVVLGAQLRFGSPAIAELFGYAGFDYVVFDCEHAPQTPAGIQAQIQAVSCTDATPIVRVPKNDPDIMRVYLDMGALGILAPFVNTAEEARTGAQALRYPPAGTRGFGPSRAAKYGLDSEYLKTADDNLLFFPLIEHVEGVKNVDEIIAVDGVDVPFIGPADLSMSMGLSVQMEHPRVEEAVEKIVNASKRAGKPACSCVYGGDLLNPDIYKKRIDQGFQVLLIGGDEWMLADSCKKVINCISKLK